MVKFSVFYPHSAGATFDMDYYHHRHVRLLRERCGEAVKRIDLECGLAGGRPGEPPQFIALGHFYFDSVESFQAAFVPHSAELVADIPNFTNVQPTAQLSEVRA